MIEVSRLSFDPLIGWPLFWALTAICVVSLIVFLFAFRPLFCFVMKVVLK